MLAFKIEIEAEVLLEPDDGESGSQRVHVRDLCSGLIHALNARTRRYAIEVLDMITLLRRTGGHSDRAGQAVLGLLDPDASVDEG